MIWCCSLGSRSSHTSLQNNHMRNQTQSVFKTCKKTSVVKKQFRIKSYCCWRHEHQQKLMQGKVLKLIGLHCPPEVSTFKTAFEEQRPIIRSSSDQVGCFQHMKIYTTPNASCRVISPFTRLEEILCWRTIRDSSDSVGFAIDLLQLMPETPPFLCPVGV